MGKQKEVKSWIDKFSINLYAYILHNKMSYKPHDHRFLHHCVEKCKLIEINLLKVEVYAIRFLGDDDEEETNDATKLDMKDNSVEQIETTSQGIAAIKMIMCNSLRLYEDVEDMIIRMVRTKAKQILEDMEGIYSSKDSDSWKELIHRQTWDALVHHEIEVHKKQLQVI